MDVNIGIIDYIGIIGDGVGILISFKIIDTIYEMIYWFNASGVVRLVTDPAFMELIGVDNIYKYSGLDDLLDRIEEVIPEKPAILKEFGLL